VVDQMVVHRSGKAVAERASTRGVLVRVAGRRCSAPTGTALAALVRSGPGRLRLRDFGSCSRRPADSGALFVSAIGSDRNRGRNGWVYKVGRRSASAGAADPAGPFGRGRLRERQRVTWFYCVLGAGGCQRTLELRARQAGGVLEVSVRGYDDEGRGRAVEGASVHVGDAVATSDSAGVARLMPPAGRHRAYAEKPGLVRSFPERLTVR
jgi:hypothetical protein